MQFDEFHAKLPTFHQFFTVHNAFWLMVVLAVTKIIHEFGHGLTCKHFGGECHELGVMFLVLTPCLYCNVSDSWMLPKQVATRHDRRRRHVYRDRHRVDLHLGLVVYASRGCCTTCASARCSSAR